MNFMEWTQRRLIAHGFDPGIVDGLWGRNTRNALIVFQKVRGIPATGTANEATVLALRAQPFGNEDVADGPDRTLLDVFPWMELALRKKGLHERRDNKALREFLVSDCESACEVDPLGWVMSE